MTEIARENNCSLSTINRRIDEYNIPKRSLLEVMKNIEIDKFPQITREYLIEQYWLTEYNMENRILDPKQKTTRQIAKESGACKSTILGRMEEYNIPRKSLSESMKDRVFSDEHRKNIGNAHRGEKNNNWKGNKAGNKPLHTWVRKNKLKSDVCEICRKKEDKNGISKLELSNIDHNTLTRNIDDYQWSHHSCHMNYDLDNGFRKMNIKKGKRGFQKN